MKSKVILVLLFSCCVAGKILGQSVTIYGIVKTAENNKALSGADVFIDGKEITTKTDSDGAYKLENLKAGTYTLVAFYMGLKTASQSLKVEQGGYKVDFVLREITNELEEVKIADYREQTNGIRSLRAVEGFGIYEAKKSEVIVLDDVVANKASNNARQIFSKVAGLNIWESDCAGLQIGVGGRGLSPNRTSNFNVRQNGYDISADALGYPESYYSPAIQAVDKVEIVRGAASLQYGTQFGGLVNFVMKKGEKDKTIAFNTEQTGNSLGFYSGFNSIGGTVGKMNYYAYNRYAKGNCWRCNSDFESVTSYVNTDFQLTEQFKIGLEYTHMYYLSKQPGGLTDTGFEEAPSQSIRDRNWFRVNWNLFALILDYKFSDQLKLNIRNSGLVSGREALGYLDRIDRVDDLGNRDLLKGEFNNWTTESRLIYNYNLKGQPSVLLVGARYYYGNTESRQGLGPDGDNADFNFINPENLEGSGFSFPGQNLAFFAENIFNINENISITPGARFEYIQTEAEGVYQDRVLVRDPNTGLAIDSVFQVGEKRNEGRSFLLFGLGMSYKMQNETEVYANISQNYRSINFNDIRVVNPNLQVDENIQDERGYNMDLGIRGRKSNILNYDLSLFYLRYSGRIGAVLRTDDNFRIFRFRTNVSDSRNIGLEAFGELNLLALFHSNFKSRLNLFGNFSVIDAKYVNSEEQSVEGNDVELVPPISIKSGLTYSREKIKMAFQYSFTKAHYSDATNAERTASAVEGIIPSYFVLDFSMNYQYNQHFGIESGVNNLSNNFYFTRRASGYPGPGIIPSDGRSFYLTLKASF